MNDRIAIQARRNDNRRHYGRTVSFKPQASLQKIEASAYMGTQGKERGTAELQKYKEKARKKEKDKKDNSLETLSSRRGFCTMHRCCSMSACCTVHCPSIATSR